MEVVDSPNRSNSPVVDSLKRKKGKGSLVVDLGTSNIEEIMTEVDTDLSKSKSSFDSFITRKKLISKGAEEFHLLVDTNNLAYSSKDSYKKVHAEEEAKVQDLKQMVDELEQELEVERRKSNDMQKKGNDAEEQARSLTHEHNLCTRSDGDVDIENECADEAEVDPHAGKD
ncbi:hypothetical protein QVD17_00011 [Tagetes erecta]|uniref:Uncharacterized protein n=1 Tax=Tagetes erecta TaxID=13708 RepID=A0AAD8LAT4_TARER|nr:hypothetical protein QVD17_00011 [Tagetes erecta]